MKKIFPIIIILITLSLVGIIIIQVSWFHSMLENKQEELSQAISRSMDEAGKEMIEERGGLLTLKMYRKPQFPWSAGDMQLVPATIAQKFTAFEIRAKLQEAFNRNKLRHTDFEFAVTSITDSTSYEERSSRFLEKVDDKINNRLFIYPLRMPVENNEGRLISGETLSVVVPDLTKVAFQQLRWMVAGAILFSLIIVTAFYITIRTLLRQKKLSEIKNDFINNMTHEFKTPIATISLAVDAMKNEKVIHDRTKMDYFSGIIKEENKRMNKHVEKILQAALTDRKEVSLNLATLHVHEVIHKVVDNFQLQLKDKNGKLKMQLKAARDEIKADEVHFTNIISNLVDNAVKYSKKEGRENLQLKITTANSGKNMVIRIQDNGIGMNKETLKRIFEKFYRAHTGNLHDVKGFGLGLSYVKKIVEAHRGKIKAESVLGKGTTFVLELPLSREKQAAVSIA